MKNTGPAFYRAGFRIFNSMQYMLANGEWLRIRSAKVDDAAALLEMFRQAVTETECLLTTPEEARGLTLEQEKEFIARYQENTAQLFLVGQVSTQIISSLSVTQSRWKKQEHMAEFGIVVLRDYWNIGVGRRMINSMLKWAEEQPLLECLHLNVMANNERAIHLYRNFGFTEYGRMRKAIRQPGYDYQDLVLIEKWLK